MIRKRLYNFWVNRNECVKYEYERYVSEHLDEHYLHRFRHIRLLIKLNMYFVYKKSKQPFLFWDDKGHPAYKNQIDDSAQREKSIEKIESNTIATKHIEEEDINQFPEIYVRKRVRMEKGCRILFISNTQRIERPISDGSTRYRCFHFAEALYNEGMYTSVTTLAEFVNNPLPLDFDIYIFHRPGRAGVKKVRELKKHQKTIIADYDDLIFGDERTALESSLYKSGRSKKETAIEIFNNNYIAMQDFDIFTCSTEDLATCILNEKKDAKVFVLHNFLPDSVLERTCNYINNSKDINQIVYCCGTTSHNNDFKEVEETIIKCLKKDLSLKLFVIGPLSINSELNSMPNVFFHGAVDYWNLFDIMSYSAFAIAPLEDTLFNACKSNVKFLESAATGVILWASPIPDMIRINKANISLCSSAEDLEKCIINRHFDYDFEKLRKNREFVEEYCSSKQFYSELKQIKDYLSRG